MPTSKLTINSKPSQIYFSSPPPRCLPTLEQIYFGEDIQDIINMSPNRKLLQAKSTKFKLKTNTESTWQQRKRRSSQLGKRTLPSIRRSPNNPEDTYTAKTNPQGTKRKFIVYRNTTSKTKRILQSLQ